MTEAEWLAEAGALLRQLVEAWDATGRVGLVVEAARDLLDRPPEPGPACDEVFKRLGG